MNKRFKSSLVISMLLMVSGCASTAINVVGTTFSSGSQPKINITTEGGLQYIGTFRNYETVQDRDHSSLTGSAYFEFYIFVNPIDKKAAKIFTIKISKLDTGFWYGDIYKEAGPKVEYGKTQLGNTNYDIFSRAIYSKSNGPVEDFIIAKGYAIPKCMYQKAFGRIVNENTRFEIFYVEDVSYYGLTCEDFKTNALLSDKTKRYIKEFGDRCLNAFKISD